MNHIIILELNINKLKGGSKTSNKISSYRYDDIVNFLISGSNLRYSYPNSDIYCKINKNIININPDIKYLLYGVFDNIVKTTSNIKENVKHIDTSQLNNNVDDNNYIYHNLKQQFGPHISNSFMFKEHDILIHQENGLDLDTKKIVYKDKKNNPLVNIICELYNILPKLIVNDYSSYYHLNKNTQYRYFNLNSMFDDVKPYDYIFPIKKLSKCNPSNSYYKNIISKYSKQKYTQSLDIYDNIDISTREFIITQYIKCMPNTFILTLWMPVDINKFIKILKKNGNVYYRKTISLTHKALKNLMFWTYDEFTYGSRLKYINKKLKEMKIKDNNNNNVTIILFDNIHNKNISGRNSKFKQYLYKEFNTHFKNKTPNDTLLHINDYFYQTVEMTELLFNRNSIDILHKQDCDKLVDNKMVISNVKLQTYRHILYKNFSLLEQDRILCTNLNKYTKTKNPFTNIDITTNDNKVDSFDDKINELFNGKNIYFIKHSKSNINMVNPSKYYYMNGVKFIKK